MRKSLKLLQFSNKKIARWSISRVLFPVTEDDHSSWIYVTIYLFATYPSSMNYRRFCIKRTAPIWSCSGWGLPSREGYPLRGALLPHHFTLTFLRRYISVALALRLPLPVFHRHPVYKEPGLSSHLTRRKRDHPTIWRC